MRRFLPALLSLNAGYVDTAGFLALQGLFTAHVTGNFVTLGAALVEGTSGVVAKLMALPVFCLVVLLVRLAVGPLAAGAGQLRRLLGVKLLLLIAGAILAGSLGPFRNGDSWPALVTGLVLVCAMAMQNAVQRIHLGSSPPTTLMTGNTTQIMIDLADLLRGTAGSPPPGRLQRTLVIVLSFACGCAAGAALFASIHMLCFAVPPVIALVTLLVASDERPAP